MYDQSISIVNVRLYMPSFSDGGAWGEKIDTIPGSETLFVQEARKCAKACGGMNGRNVAMHGLLGSLGKGT